MMMRQSNRKSDVMVTIGRDSLVISVSGIVTARSLDAILREIVRENRNKSSVPHIADLILDLSAVKVIRPSGATSLVCLCSALMMDKLSGLASPSVIYLRQPPEAVSTYLARIGFFTLMSAKAKLLGYGDLVRRDFQLREQDMRKRMDGVFNRGSGNENRPVVWPMQIIAQKDIRNSYRTFEDDCQRLVNDAADHFDELFSSPHFNFDQGDRHDFRQAIYELFMNVYEHSDSWGLAMIHAQLDRGTFICCHDIGIGIRESLTDSPSVKETIENDYQAIKWVLVEGHSRKVGGNGIGLNIIEDFVSERNGTIEIRSGECLLRKTTLGDARWKPYHVPWFPGTQLNLFVPVRLEHMGGSECL